MRKYILLILTLFFSFNIIVNAKVDNKVYDYANIFTKREENKINKKISNYVKGSNINLVVITVRHHEYEETNDYLEAYYNKNMEGSSIIFCIDYKLDNISMKSFGSSEDVYTRQRIRSILNNIKEEETNYDKVNTFIEEIKKDFSIYTLEDLIKNIIISILLSLLITSIIYMIRKRITPKKINKEENIVFLDYDKSKIKTKEEVFIKAQTRKDRTNKKD